ncbi:MAG: hypothetical protein J1F35_04140 [Erysipelotrichales bacterium]|nr:hypothetical protein [Erysipelotrichales bacterium]
MKKIKSLDYLLSFGVFILFFASISLMNNEIFGSALLKCSGLALISFIFYMLALIFKYQLKVSASNKVSYTLGSLILLVAYYVAGANKLFGNWFSVSGGGSHVFLASVTFLVAIFSILAIVFYKKYNIIYITFLSIIETFVLICNFSITTTYIIISLFLLITNIFKINKYLYKFSCVAIYINALIVIGILIAGTRFMSASILVIINSFSILYLLHKNKGFEYQLLSFILTSLLLISYYNNALITHISSNVVLVLIISLTCAVDLCLNTFRLFNNTFVKILHKVFVLIFLIVVVMYLPADNIAHLIATVFIILSSLISSYALHNEDYEEYVLPIKFFFILYYVHNLVEINILSTLFGLLGLTDIAIYKKAKTKRIKTFYLIFGLVSILCMFAYINNSIIEIIASIVISTLVYILIRERKSVDSLIFVVYILLMLGLLELGYVSFAPLLIMIILAGLVAYINREDKFNLVLSIGYLLIVINQFFNTVIADYTTYVILISLMYFLLSGITSELVFETAKSKNIFSTIVFALGFLWIFDNNPTLLILIYSLILSLVIILLSIKKTDYKSLYYVGIIAGIISLLKLLSFLENVPTAIYLLVISIILIIVVSLMIYRSQNKNK